MCILNHNVTVTVCMSSTYYLIVSDIAIFVLKRDVKLQLTNTYYLTEAV